VRCLHIFWQNILYFYCDKLKYHLLGIREWHALIKLAHVILLYFHICFVPELIELMNYKMYFENIAKLHYVFLCCDDLIAYRYMIEAGGSLVWSPAQATSDLKVGNKAKYETKQMLSCASQHKNHFFLKKIFLIFTLVFGTIFRPSLVSTRLAPASDM